MVERQYLNLRLLVGLDIRFRPRIDENKQSAHHHEYAHTHDNSTRNEHITRISGGAPVWLGGIRKGDRYRGKPLAIADRKPGDPGKVGPGAEDWYWSDGRPWTYTNWGPGEPNNWDGGENRVQHLGKFGAVWNDVGEDGRTQYTEYQLNPRHKRNRSTRSKHFHHLNPVFHMNWMQSNKRPANITFVIDITLFIFGLPCYHRSHLMPKIGSQC